MFPLFPSLQTERDVSVRQRAVDLLYAMCDRSNAKQIVAEMLSYLETADYSIREEIVGGHYSQWGLSCNELLLRVASALNPFFSFPDFHQVLKVAILAEKYAVDYTWYVDTILNLIRIAGDHVSEEVWYRVIQIVINRDDVQGYAAKTVFEVSLKLCVQCMTVILNSDSFTHGLSLVFVGTPGPRLP